MKLRSQPKDFIVEEIPLRSMQITAKEGPFRIYKVTKTGIETFALLGQLSRGFRIPLHDLGIAGLKDKHAITTQYLSVPAKYKISELSDPDLKISFLGHAQERIRFGDLEGNHFEITVRDLRQKQIDEVRQQITQRADIPNYFDSQRFGSVINRIFIGRFLLNNQY